MNRDGTARQCAPKSRLFDLPHSFANTERIVLGDSTFRLHREHSPDPTGWNAETHSLSVLLPP